MRGPTATNAAAGVLNDVISAIMSGGVVAAEAYLTALDPALMSIPIVQWLVDEGVGHLAQILTVAGERFGDSLIIDFQTGTEASDVLTTGTALALAQASGNETAIAAAVQAATDSWRSLIGYDGWATPS